jgi:hypothetical protein
MLGKSSQFALQNHFPTGSKKMSQGNIQLHVNYVYRTELSSDHLILK